MLLWSQKSSRAAERHEGCSQKGKTRLGCFSAFCHNQSVLLLLLIHRQDSTGHSRGCVRGSVPGPLALIATWDTHMPQIWHHPPGQSDLPDGQQSSVTLLWREVDGAAHLGCSSISSVFSVVVLCCKSCFASKLTWHEQKWGIIL